MDAVQIRKAVIFSIRICYRSVCRHPFLLGMVFFLIFLYRSFPFTFSLLVSASPVFISTAVLLGTLLSFGQPNIPDIEKEETTHEIVSLKTGVPTTDAIVVERDGSYNVERYTDIRRDGVEKSIEEASSTANNFSEVDKDDPLLDKSTELQFDKWETEEGERESSDTVHEKKNDLNELKQGDGEILRNQYSPIQELDEKRVDVLEKDKFPEGYVGYVTVDRISPPGSPWKHGDEREEADNDVSDSGSDGAESSSPDASMTDIIPLLDELHPLLDEDAPQPAHMSHEGTDATSENSPKSFSDGSNELGEDMENCEEELEVGDDEEEEEAHVDKDDETKSAIRWTEDDQKNLMDLGTSELERNQRLENLIARRRLRNSMKLMAEKNLIDLDGADLPFNIAHISTSRQNPFDLPYDPNNDMGLPPIPGSAPSILLPRRNPFDLPYDSSEEKPDLMGDDFQQDVMTLQSKEPFFRRNETFNVGPSVFGTSRHDYKYKPYFVPEQMASEGTSYSALHRQSSELSESKASSVPETESISSAEDLEDKKPTEEDFSHESQLNSIAEPELISIAEHPSEHVGHGSESSEDEDSFKLRQVEKRDAAADEIEVKLGDVEDYKEMVSRLSKTTAVATPVERNASGVHLKMEAPKLKYSSSSSFSEVDEEILSEKEGGQLSSSEPLKGDLIEDPSISRQPLTEKSDIDITSQLVDDNQHGEPVYDSSPRALEKNLSSSSVCSDLHVETTETSSPPVLVKRSLSFTEKDSEVDKQSVEKSTPAIEADEKLVSAHYQSPSEETPLPESEKELPLSDQSVNEPAPGNPELQDSTNKLNDLELRERDDIVQPTTNSLVTLEPTPMQSEVIEIKTPVAVLEDKILDSFENGEQIQVLEQHTFPVEATDSPGNMQNNMENVDDIEEINEEFLFELDTVGDFGVQHLGSNMTESDGENFHMRHDAGNSSGDVKGDPILVHETRVTMDDENLRAPRVEEGISKSEGELEESPEIQKSGTKSVEHVDSSIREIVHKEVEDHRTDSQITNNEPLLEATADEHADSKVVQDPNAKVINSDMPDVEVRAIEDIDPSFKEAEPISAEINVVVGESETEVGMSVLEAKSLEDIKSAFNQVQVDENESEKSFVVDSVHAELSPDKTMTGYSQHEMLKGSISLESKSDSTVLESRSIQDEHSAFEQHHEGIDDRLILPGSNGGNLDNAESQDPVHVAEAISAEDTNVALVQGSEANLEKLPMSTSETESLESEVNEEHSSKAIELMSEVSGLVESSSASAEKQPKEVETSEDLRKSDAGHKKANSHKLSSNSSSSSSSGDGE